MIPARAGASIPFNAFISRCQQLEQTFKLLHEAGGIVEGDSEIMPWGERLFYARDPFGNPIAFVDEHRTFTGTRLNTPIQTQAEDLG